MEASMTYYRKTARPEVVVAEFGYEAVEGVVKAQVDPATDGLTYVTRAKAPGMPYLAGRPCKTYAEAELWVECLPKTKAELYAGLKPFYRRGCDPLFALVEDRFAKAKAAIAKP